MKAEIRQLLKEVSGELKQLQAQLSKSQDQPQPDAGNGTDPQLYGTPEPPSASSGAPLPMALRTDDKMTARGRPGGGTGTPGRETLAGTPQMQAEEASLSATPAEERAGAKQPIPPEYRPVFERLHQQEKSP